VQVGRVVLLLSSTRYVLIFLTRVFPPSFLGLQFFTFSLLAAVETISDPRRMDPRRTRVLLICFIMIKNRAGAYQYTITVTTIIVVTGAEARGRREELVFGFSNNCF